MTIDANQLAELWREHAPSLRLLARTRCDVAEDCVQEAFIRLSVQSTLPTDPMAWLVRVVRNEAIDRSRSEHRRRVREQKIASDQPLWFVEESSEREMLPTEEIQRALTKLDEDSREVIVAHLWNGLSFRQIASVLDMSSSAAHRKYIAALEQLRGAY